MQVPPLRMSREEVRETLAGLRHPVRVAIDRAKNGFNIGTMIRTAHSFLVKEIILIGATPWYKRAAMGMHTYENVTELPSSAAFLEVVQRERWSLVAFEKDHDRASVGLWQAAFPDDAVLVFGNENDGVDPAILAAADQVVTIPMYGINHSYPVSVAAGMALAEWARRRYQHGRRLTAGVEGQRVV